MHTSSPLNGQPTVLDEAATCSPTACFSIDQDFCVPATLQGPPSEYFSTASQQSYPLLGQDGLGMSQAPQMPAQSFRPLAGGGSIRTSSSPSSHPYYQARLYHTADRAFSQHQGRSRIPFPALPAPAPVSGTMSPYNVVVDNRASTHCHNSNQLPLVAEKFAPTLTFGSAFQSNIVAPNTNPNVPSPMGGLTVPGQPILSTYQMPALPPYTPADQADVEYAQHRYGNKRCFYQCRFDLLGSPCNKWIVGDRTRVLRHLRSHHHLQTGPATPAFCRWGECTHPRPMKQENLSRHVVMHLGVKWRCPHCRRLFSRDDAVHRHIERMVPGMDVTDAEVVPGREARAISEPQPKRARIA